MNTLLTTIGVIFMISIVIFGNWNEIRSAYKIRRFQKLIAREHAHMMARNKR